jgi:hypothetical protein
MESVSCAGQSTPPGRLLGVRRPLPRALRGARRPPLQGGARDGPARARGRLQEGGHSELEWEDQRKQLLETIDGTALKSAL